MLTNYNLAVIGNNEYAYQLVTQATQQQASVAWIVGGDPDWGNTNHLARLNTQLHQLGDRSLDVDFGEEYDSLVAHMFQFLDVTASAERQTLSSLKGVNVLYGEYHLGHTSSSQGILEVTVKGKDQSITSQQIRAEVLAIANEFDVYQPLLWSGAEMLAHAGNGLRPIFGLSELSPSAPLRNAANLSGLKQFLRTKPVATKASTVAMLGHDGLSCAIAQILKRLGMRVIFISPDRQIIPHIDVAIARLLQAQMESAQIEIYTHTQVTAVQKQPEGIRLWTEHRVIDSDYLFLPSPIHSVPPAYIYPCQSHQDVKQIMDAVLQPPVWQALSQSISNHQTKDRLISASSCITFMPTMPPIAQVSMPSNANPYAILESITTDGGLCKVMCDQQGYILGASICSEQAESVLGAIAMAMRGKVKISELPLISGYLADLHLPEQWQQWQ